MKSFGWTNVTKVRKAGFSLTEWEFPAFPAEVVFLGILLWASDGFTTERPNYFINNSEIKQHVHTQTKFSQMMVIKWELQKIKRWFYVFQAKTASAPTAA